eukprot:283991_1
MPGPPKVVPYAAAMPPRNPVLGPLDPGQMVAEVGRAGKEYHMKELSWREVAVLCLGLSPVVVGAAPGEDAPDHHDHKPNGHAIEQRRPRKTLSLFLRRLTHYIRARGCGVDVPGVRDWGGGGGWGEPGAPLLHEGDAGRPH